MKTFSGDLTDQLTNRLVSYYKMDDASDFFGANNLINTGATPFVLGKLGNCASFDGALQSLATAAPLSTDTQDISVFFWVYLFTNLESNYFFYTGDNTRGYGFGVGDTALGTNGNHLIGYLPLVAWLNFNVNIGTGWHFVGITRDTSTWRGYIDGVVCPTTFANNPNAIGATTSVIGNTGWGNPMKVDEFGFWRRQLSQTEITFLYNAGAGLTMTDPAINPTVPTTAIANSLSVNHSAYYGGAMQSFDIVFPWKTLSVLAEVFDRNASGMRFQKAAENAFYQILTPNKIRIRFHAEMEGDPAGVYTDAHGLKFAYPAVWPEVGLVDHSDVYQCAIGDGKNYFQHYYFTMDLTVDVSTLGILPHKRKHHGGELWGIVPEIANYIG